MKTTDVVSMTADAVPAIKIGRRIQVHGRINGLGEDATHRFVSLETMLPIDIVCAIPRELDIPRSAYVQGMFAAVGTRGKVVPSPCRPKAECIIVTDCEPVDASWPTVRLN